MRAFSRRVKPLGVVALTAALVSALSGCSGSGGATATNGPLRNDAQGIIPSGSICAPGGEPQTFGDQQFTDYGHVTVVLDRVVLLDPHNERLIASYAIPGKLLIGTVPWPPSEHAWPYTWKYRQPVRGFKLASGKSFDMVLGVTAIRTGQATSRGVLVYYHDSAGSYLAKNYFANIIAATKTGC
jgi:hypothetical protein